MKIFFEEFHAEAQRRGDRGKNFTTEDTELHGGGQAEGFVFSH
jgi:hypothetical protein